MEDFFRSGLLADVILFVMIAEAVFLLVYRKVTGRGLAPTDLFSMLLAGGCLVLALRAVLTGSSWPVVMLFLLAALIAHLTDLYRRWLCQSRGAIDGKAR
jgi:hypothetical protein